MSDIVERLRREGVEFHEQLEAADTIERLRAALQEAVDSIAAAGPVAPMLLRARADEIDRLLTENMQLRRWIAPDILELTDEIERLREHVNALRLVATSHEPEIERLRAALSAIGNNQSIAENPQQFARRALEPKP